MRRNSLMPPQTQASVCRIISASLSSSSLKRQRPPSISPVATGTGVKRASRAWLSMSSGPNGSSIRLAPDLDLDRGEALADIAGDFLAEHVRRLAGKVVAAAGISGHAVGARGAEIFVERQLRRTGVAVPE